MYWHTMPSLHIFVFLHSLYLSALFLITHLSFSSGTCYERGTTECTNAPFVPGYNLIGEGFDVVTLKRKGAYLIDVQTYLNPNGACTLCENPYKNNQLQKLLLSTLDWRAKTDCSQTLSSEVYTSVNQLIQSITDGITNNWTAGLDLITPGLSVGFELGGTQSEVTRFAVSRSKVDQSAFSIHELSCVYYRYRLSSNPPLSQDFRKALSALPRSYAKQSYRTFVDKFGTHFIRQVDLGGKFLRVTAIRTCLSRLNGLSTTEAKECLTRNISATYGITHTPLGGNKCSSVQQNHDITTNYNSEYLVQKTQVTGGQNERLVLSNGQGNVNVFSTWLESLKTSPDVVSYSVEPLNELVKDPVIKNHVQRAIIDYLSDNKLSKNSPNPTCQNSNPNLSQDCCPLQTRMGKLEVTMIRASNLKGDWFGRTEAYAIIYYGGASQTTNIIVSKNPVWNVKYDFGFVDTSFQLRVQLWDDDIWYDDLIGECFVSVSSGTKTHTCAAKKRGNFEFSYTLTCDNHLMGEKCELYKASP